MHTVPTDGWFHCPACGSRELTEVKQDFGMWYPHYICECGTVSIHMGGSDAYPQSTMGYCGNPKEHIRGING